jgi:FixJ family two-component response regulator
MNIVMNKLRILLVEDDIAIQEAFIALLSKTYQIDCFNSAEDFLNGLNDLGLKENISTCIVLDFQLPGMSGIELQNILAARNISLPILFISGNAKQIDIIDAWHGGAIDFLLKPFTGPKLSETLKTLFQKFETESKPTISTAKKIPPNSTPISQREAQVLLLLGEGYRQYEIAEMLSISLRTIKWHRSNIKDKLDLKTLAELGRYCDANRRAIENVAKGCSK